MSLISIIYASAPSSDLLIPTLEFNNEIAGVIRLAQSFNDVAATTELAETVTFIESAWEVSLPNKDATGQQTLQFQICNVTGEAQRFIDDCLKSGKPTSVIYREFYASDLSAPLLLSSLSAFFLSFSLQRNRASDQLNYNTNNRKS